MYRNMQVYLHQPGIISKLNIYLINKRVYLSNNINRAKLD
jgi:hypothetical protein